MSDTSARLSLPYIAPSQAQKHVTHNEALQALDILTQLTIEGFGAATPPPLPEEGQVWALGSAPAGAWAGHGGALAAWVNGAWLFFAPQDGWRGVSKTDGALRIYGGGEWAPIALDNLDGIGVNASHDATNRLTVSSPATLLNHEGAGHQVKVNKAAVDDTASLLFQTNWSGRAEMGTAGSDDFAIKVSADGAAWNAALSIDAATGALQTHAGQTFFEDVFILDDTAWSFDIPWSNPARILLWLGVNMAGWHFLLSVTGTFSGATNFTEMFTNPPGKLNFHTGPLTGTTGVDDAVTLSIDASGAAPRMFVENRIGSNRLFTLATMGK